MTIKVFYFVNGFNTLLIKKDTCDCVEHLIKHAHTRTTHTHVHVRHHTPPIRCTGAQLAVTICWLKVLRNSEEF